MSTPAATQPWAPRTVGIALAAYQPNPEWLAEQLESIVAQTHTEWICIITMDSPLRDIAEHSRIRPFITDPRFTWIENGEQLGVRKNFEKAIALATAKNMDAIAFSDQDDIWLPEKLSVSLAELTKTGPMSLVNADAYLFVDDLVLSDTLHSLHRIVSKKLAIEEVIIYPSVSGFTVVADARLTQRYPTIPEPMRFHDHWFSVVATAHQGITRISLPLALYRQHENNAIGISSIRSGVGLPPINRAANTADRVRRLGEQHLGSAKASADQLPMHAAKRLLFRHRTGWMLLMLAIIARRLFVERRLVVQANRALFAQLLVFPSQAERAKVIRARLPVPRRLLKRVALAACVLALGLAALNAGLALSLVFSAAVPLWFGLAAGALAAPAWNLVRHLYPNAGLTLVGLSAVLAGLLRAATDSPVLGVLAFALPVAWYLAYRIRWRGDTGF